MIGFAKAVAQLLWTLVAATGTAAWLTHLVVCLLVGKWVLLLAGAVLVPVGVVHGIGVWLDVFRY